jgi:hypothetical protein
MWASG